MHNKNFTFPRCDPQGSIPRESRKRDSRGIHKNFILFFIFFSIHAQESEFIIKKKPKIEANLNENIISVFSDILDLEISLENNLITLRKSFLNEMKYYLKDEDMSFLINNSKIKKQELLNELRELKKEFENNNKLLLKKISSITNKLKG